MAAEDKTPVLRVPVGRDPMSVTANGAPDFAYIQMGWQAIHNGAESARQGRPVYDKALIVTHIYPGTTDELDVEVRRYPSDGGEMIVMDPVRNVKFGDALDTFEKRAADLQKGTPLSVLNFDPAQIKNMEAAGAATVEMLADVPDHSIAKLGMGARGLRERARGYMASLSGGEEMAKLQAQHDAATAEIDELRRAVRELTADRKPVPIGYKNEDSQTGDGAGDMMGESVTGADDEEKRASANGKRKGG